jgi:predicted ribosome quality control (RQC) complex YloA/Tae2 family protein
MRVEINLNKSIESNASEYYEKIKKLKKKLEGARKASENTKLLLEKLNKERQSIALNSIKKAETKKEWYEKFRWFISPEDFLILGGRDATSNEILIKKHTEPKDLVFHTDMVGSPFFVIKTNGKSPSEQTIKEAADATVTFSRAFKLGFGTTKTFMAKPEQLTKEAKPGEYVPKGGFITTGKLTYVDNKINLAVGNYNEKVMAGPLESIKKHCKNYITLEPGKEKPAKIAKTIQYKIGCNVDDIVRSLPSGTFKIKK